MPVLVGLLVGVASCATGGLGDGGYGLGLDGDASPGATDAALVDTGAHVDRDTGSSSDDASSSAGDDAATGGDDGPGTGDDASAHGDDGSVAPGDDGGTPTPEAAPPPDSGPPTGCVPPNTYAPCHACSGSSCQPNGCYNKYVCDTRVASDIHCTKPGTCP
jgi:hypothetical protein